MNCDVSGDVDEDQGAWCRAVSRSLRLHLGKGIAGEVAELANALTSITKMEELHQRSLNDGTACTHRNRRTAHVKTIEPKLRNCTINVLYHQSDYSLPTGVSARYSIDEFRSTIRLETVHRRVSMLIEDPIFGYDCPTANRLQNSVK